MATERELEDDLLGVKKPRAGDVRNDPMTYAKRRGAKAGKGSAYYVEGGTPETPTRTGPYRDPAKARARQRSDTQAWKNVDKVGKKPELTEQPPGWRGTEGLTTPTHRVSPRTRTMSRKATIPGAGRNQREAAGRRAQLRDQLGDRGARRRFGDDYGA